MKPVQHFQFECKSHPDNYYHFLVDYVLPFFHYVWINRLLGKPLDVVVHHHEPEKFNHFSAIFTHLFPGYHLTVESSDPPPAAIRIARFNPKTRNARELVIAFSSHTCGQIDKPKQEGMVLIERSAKPRSAQIADGRPHLRYISNQSELSAELKQYCDNKGMAFRSIRNENMSFPEQVRIYQSAGVLIGLHGAGLTNLLWMNRGTCLVELQTSKRLPFFKNLASLKQLNYREALPLSWESSVPNEVASNAECGRDEIVEVDVQQVVRLLEMPPIRHRLYKLAISCSNFWKSPRLRRLSSSIV